MAAGPYSFVEAIEYAESLGVVLPDAYYGALLAVQRGQAVSIAGLASLEQIKFVIDLVTKALKDGSTFKEFQQRVASNDLGVALPKDRLDNIFRTNMQVSYNKGRWDQQARVAHSRPYLMYDAINDSRTRPTHLAMDNTVLPRDHPFWNTHYTPCGYRCRCTVISLTEAQARKRGLTEVVPDAEPDEGWDFNPGKDYSKGVKDGLAAFGDSLLGDHPKLGKAIAEAKDKIKEAALIQGQNTSGLESKQPSK